MASSTGKGLPNPVDPSNIEHSRVVSDAQVGRSTPDSVHVGGNLPTVQNVIASCDLNVLINLQDLTLHIRNAEYKPKRFCAVVVRIREPRSTALIFASGKLIVTGTKSEEDARLAARKHARIIQKQGYTVRFTDFKIQNVVASGPIGGESEGINVRALAKDPDHQHFAKFEPERFPGLIYAMHSPIKCTLMIFHKGKMVITGAKSRQDIYAAWEQIMPLVRLYPLLIEDFSKKAPDIDETNIGVPEAAL